MNRAPFAPDEWYHCYSRGVEKRKTFLTHGDFSRFQELLYLCNSEEAIHRSNLPSTSHATIFAHERKQALVDVGAYALMPNHFHLLLREGVEGGISSFMRKLGTAYTMYFNIKNERVGNLFVKPFRSRHIEDDRYLRKAFAYVHLNPVELHTPGWKVGDVPSLKEVEDFISKYSYSSFIDYASPVTRPEKSIISSNAAVFLSEYTVPLVALLREGREYYAEHAPRAERLA